MVLPSPADPAPGNKGVGRQVEEGKGDFKPAKKRLRNLGVDHLFQIMGEEGPRIGWLLGGQMVEGVLHLRQWAGPPQKVQYKNQDQSEEVKPSQAGSLEEKKDSPHEEENPHEVDKKGDLLQHAIDHNHPRLSGRAAPLALTLAPISLMIRQVK